MTWLNLNLGSYYGGGTLGGYGTSGYTKKTVSQTDINDLIRFIENGNAKQVMQKYNDLNASGDSLTRNRIENHFMRLYGQDLTTTLEQSAGSSFASGLKQGCAIFGLFDDGFSGDELEAQITGVDESKGSKFAEYFGGVISSAASTAGMASLATLVLGGAALPALAIGGAVAGAVTGIIKVAHNDKQNTKATANA